MTELRSVLQDLDYKSILRGDLLQESLPSHLSSALLLLQEILSQATSHSRDAGFSPRATCFLKSLTAMTGLWGFLVSEVFFPLPTTDWQVALTCCSVTAQITSRHRGTIKSQDAVGWKGPFRSRSSNPLL